MGTICTTSMKQKEQQSTIEPCQSYQSIKVALGQGSVTLEITGSDWKQIKAFGAVLITDMKSIEQNSTLRQFLGLQFQKIHSNILLSKKTLHKHTITEKFYPYKRLYIITLPIYISKQLDQYLQKLRAALNEIILETEQIMIQFHNTIDNIHTIQNQTIISVLLDSLLKIDQQRNNRNSRVSNSILQSKINNNLVIISCGQKKMQQIVKYQILKTQNWKIVASKKMEFGLPIGSIDCSGKVNGINSINNANHYRNLIIGNRNLDDNLNI